MKDRVPGSSSVCLKPENVGSARTQQRLLSTGSSTRPTEYASHPGRQGFREAVLAPQLPQPIKVPGRPTFWTLRHAPAPHGLRTEERALPGVLRSSNWLRLGYFSISSFAMASKPSN